MRPQGSRNRSTTWLVVVAAALVGALLCWSVLALLPRVVNLLQTDRDESTDPPPVQSSAGLDIYVAPDDDCDSDNSGRRSSEPVCDLHQAQEVLEDARSDGAGEEDVTVRFEPGEYDIGTFYWSLWARPGHTLRFVPDWWEEGREVPDDTPLPEFDGEGESDFWVSLVRHGQNQSEEVGSVVFSHLQLRGYANGIMVNGGVNLEGSSERVADAVGPAVPYVGIHHLRMNHIGNKGSGDESRGEAAIGLRNVADGVVSDSVFEDLENNSDDEVYLHAVYAMHAHSVLIESNVFSDVSGDPIRLRNANTGFVVSDNTFRRAGSRATVSDWYVDKESARDRGQRLEAPSEEPKMQDNAFLGGGYDGQEVDPWTRYQSS